MAGALKMFGGDPLQGGALQSYAPVSADDASMKTLTNTLIGRLRPYAALRNQQYAKPQQSYQTVLPEEHEQAFRQWVQQHNIPFNPDDPKSDYDMRAYWLALQNHTAQATSVNANDGEQHYTDEYKTPYHASFSGESNYAKPGGPQWINGSQLADRKTGEVLYDEQQLNRLNRNYLYAPQWGDR